MKKKKLPPTGMAARYESAWNQIVSNLPEWKREFVIHNPFGHHAADAAREACRLAEQEPVLPVAPIAPSGEPII